MRRRLLRAFVRPRIKPISPAFPPMTVATLKAAAPDRGCRGQASPPLATFPPAHALVIRLLPSREQRTKCLRIGHEVTPSWSTCIRYGHQRYPVL